MKNLYTLLVAFFVVNIYSQEIEEPKTVVPENPENLIVDSIDIQSGTIQSLQKTQEEILKTTPLQLTPFYKNKVTNYFNILIND